MSERCRVVAEFGHCDRPRGHRADPDDRGHEIELDGTIVFRWTPRAAGWAYPNGGWLTPERVLLTPAPVQRNEEQR